MSARRAWAITMVARIAAEAKIAAVLTRERVSIDACGWQFRNLLAVGSTGARSGWAVAVVASEVA